MEEKKLFLLDAYALIFRAFYGLGFERNAQGESVAKALLNSKGFNTTAVRGFTDYLNLILTKEKPSHIAVVFDFKAQTFRSEEHSFYKANREETPEGIKLSEPYIRRIIEGFKIPIIEVEGFEADDVIGTLAKQKEKEGFTVYMVTPDKDFAQLVSPNIFIYKPSRSGKGHEILGVPEITENWEVEDPLQVIDILGMWGDSVDNIPGIPGVGEKTAKKFIKAYGSMEGLYENVEELKGKMKEKVIENKEQAFISKKLATIVVDVPITCANEDLLLSEPDLDILTEVFQEMEFKNLAKRILGKDIIVKKAKPSNGQMDLFNAGGADEETQLPSNKNTIENTKHHYKLVDSEKALQDLVIMLEKQSELAFDTETTGLDVMNETILGVSFSIKSNEAYYVPLNEENRTAFLAILKPLFENEQVVKIAQNLKYDMHILANYDIKIKGPFYDTMLAHYLLEPDLRHNMDFLSENYLNYEPMSIESLIGKKGKNQKKFDSVELEEQIKYAAEDADVTFQLAKIFQPLLKENKIEQILQEIEMPLLPVLCKMERNGVKVDENFLNDYAKVLNEEILAIRTNIFDAVGYEFNMDSPKQLGDVLFDELEIPYKGSKTKTGQYKTGEDVLTNYQKDYPIVSQVLEYRQIAKLKSTYVEALPKLIDPKTGKIHTTFSQAVASTGRLSSVNPNLQNIPIRTERGRKVRQAFIPSDDKHVLMAADYSQIELRLIAEMSGDKNMLAAFKDGLDIHSATAANIFNVPLEEVTREMRNNAKTVNFGIIYGVSAFGLSQQTNLTRKESKEVIESYFRTYPGIKEYMDNNILKAQKDGYVSTILGRKRILKDINSPNAIIRNSAERNAINAPVQGSAADMIKLAMINIDKEMCKRNMQSLMTLQVHDELVFDVLKTELEDLKELVIKEMESAMPGLKVPILVEVGVGESWLEAH